MDEPMADHVVSIPATSSSTQLPTTEEKSVSEKIWVVDDEPSPDYPVWTRANVGEVFPDIVTPMGWTMWGFEGAELGWRDALVRTGAFSPDEFAADRKEIVGSFGGYCYLNVSVSRVFDGAAPGRDAYKPRLALGSDIAPSGTVLTGLAGCAGTHTGRARVLTEPGDPGELEPGDVLVAVTTDSSWGPLFLTAGAVVVDTGAAVSHAVIVSRELGTPCAVSVIGATQRIANGAMVTVDGTTGTVTIL